MENSEHSNDKNRNIEIKYLNNMPKTWFLKANNSLLKLEKDFIKLKDKEQKDREVKIKREIEELFFKGMLWPIFCIDINTHSDREWKLC